ncbi:helix-turn-helix transcriptional regulator [Paenibacillus silviterrae]|uniref:helix-turn-helix transcriptional regulator n=1 Tax=Paenibacillus silviterrae TaxID=3242194 RepID=UPI002542FF98|nr:YafY family protein [Paenibacillus chinjuensis]
MSKSKRLIELMIAVNKRRKFTVRELAEEFAVSSRTIMRDLQALEELGLPLYAEYGPNGGYRLLNEHLLPPIVFSEQEAVAIFFAYQSLQHYGSLPFDEEAVTALNKFYYYLPDDTKRTIDKMKQRVIFWSPKRKAPSPHLRLLLDASLQMRPVRVLYDSREGAKSRTIQPIGVYSQNGYWYCPAYCFHREKYLLFRVDRVLQAEQMEEGAETVDVSGYPLQMWFLPQGQPVSAVYASDPERMPLIAELTTEGVSRFQWEGIFHDELQVNDDGTGILRLHIREDDFGYYTQYFLSMGADAVIREPQELREQLRQAAVKLFEAYHASKPSC